LNGQLSSTGNKVWLYEKECIWNGLIQNTADFISGIETQVTLQKKILVPHNIVGRRVNEMSGKK